MRKFVLVMLCFVLATASVFGAVDYNKYVYNGSAWVPMLAESDGRALVQLNLLNITSIYASFAQKVGIGTYAPTEELEVIGNISATQDVCILGSYCLSTAGGVGMNSFNISGDTGTQNITDGDGVTLDGINSIVTTGVATDTIRIDIVDNSINGTELADTITLDAILALTGQDINISNTLYVNTSSSRVGFGTSNPSEKIEVVGNEKISGYINMTVTNGNSRYMGNGCVEKVNSTGVHFIC